MASRKPEAPDSGGESAESEASEASGPRVVVLTRDEVEALLRCCRRYRSTLPFYLQSAKAEFDALTSIIEKLEASAEAGD
jgi:hypothetical protein